MSGRPWPGGVTQATQLLEELAEIERESADLRPFVERSNIIRTRYPLAARELRELLRSMDIDDSQFGNYGWEGRFAWFLEEMRRQLSPSREPGLLDDALKMDAERKRRAG